MVECPYCEKEVEVNHDDSYGYEENKAYEQECSNCLKTFIYYTQISFDHEAIKAPCKNGKDHKLRKIHGAPAAYFKYKRMCEYCDERFTIDENADRKVISEYHESLSKKFPSK